MRLVLASASPRRAELLRAAGFTFEILASMSTNVLAPGERPRLRAAPGREKSARALEILSRLESGRLRAPSSGSADGSPRAAA